MWRKMKLKGLIWKIEEVGARFKKKKKKKKKKEMFIGAKLVVRLEHASSHCVGGTEIF